MRSPKGFPKGYRFVTEGNALVHKLWQFERSLAVVLKDTASHMRFSRAPVGVYHGRCVASALVYRFARPEGSPLG